MTEDAQALVGFDYACDPDDDPDELVVVMLRREPGRPWQIEHLDKPPQVDTSWIAKYASDAAARRPAWKPPPGAPTLPELVEQWLTDFQPPHFHLDDQQRAMLAELYAADIAAGRLTPMLSRKTRSCRTT